jgi:hypothetical protein
MQSSHQHCQPTVLIRSDCHRPGKSSSECNLLPILTLGQIANEIKSGEIDIGIGKPVLALDPQGKPPYAFQVPVSSI